MKGNSSKRKSSRIEGKKLLKIEVKTESSQPKGKTQHRRTKMPRPSEAILNDANGSLPNEPDSSANVTLGSLHELMLRSLDKVERFTGRTTEINENVTGLRTELHGIVLNHDRRIDALEGRVRAIEQTGRGNGIPGGIPDPVDIQARPGRAICCYCQKHFALSYVYTHQKRQHAEEVHRNRAHL